MKQNQTRGLLTSECQYELFWENPRATPTAWIGLLFGIICLAAQFQRLTMDPGRQFLEVPLEGPSELQTMVDTFRLRIVQCLALSEYAKGGPYVLEALILYFTDEVFLAKDADIRHSILLGTIVQLAMHMGYHRDPRHFTTMSPYVAEMRRRVWATIVDIDLGISFQMGLPRLIKQWQADTQAPHNLLDTDFDKDSPELPPARPEEEMTPMLYRVLKSRMMSVIGLISDFTADTRPSTYAEVMKIDQRLETVYSSIPKCMQWRSLAHCIMDPPPLITQKLFLDIIFCKGKLVLHRKHLAPSFTQSEFSYSRTACLEAAMRLLAHQQMLAEETRPLCQLHQERWKITALLNHDFLLATSILCFYLWQRQNIAQEAADEQESLETTKVALKKSHAIWQQSRRSKEAQKAARALRIVLSHPVPSETDSTVDANLQSSAEKDYYLGSLQSKSQAKEAITRTCCLQPSLH